MSIKSFVSSAYIAVQKAVSGAAQTAQGAQAGVTQLVEQHGQAAGTAAGKETARSILIVGLSFVGAYIVLHALRR